MGRCRRESPERLQTVRIASFRRRSRRSGSRWEPTNTGWLCARLGSGCSGLCWPSASLLRKTRASRLEAETFAIRGWNRSDWGLRKKSWKDELNMSAAPLTFALLMQLLHGAGVVERLLLFWFVLTFHLQIELRILNRLRARPYVSHGWWQ